MATVTLIFFLLLCKTNIDFDLYIYYYLFYIS